MRDESINNGWREIRDNTYVVSCAGWKWVNPSVGMSPYVLANVAMRSMLRTSFGKRMRNPSRIMTVKSSRMRGRM